MPISITALAANRKTLKIDFDGETLTLTYRPSAINAAQEDREITDKSSGHHVLSIIRSLVETIERWDLVDEAGQTLPISEESLRPLGIDVLNRISTEIIRDSLPNRTTPSTSSNGSSAAAV